jgi:hypothetical protein
MKELLLLCCLLFLLFSSLFATHNKGGEITCELLNAATRTYRVTITTYTNFCPACNPVPPDREFLDSVHWGDGQTETFNRVYHTDSLGDNIRVNRYIATHSYSSPGVYKIYFIDPNRNADIVNIPFSVNIPFCIETTLAIHNLNCPLTPMQFQGIPFFKAQINRPFRHNMTILDQDHDSLSFGLVNPLMGYNTPVTGYTMPGGLTISAVSGQINWNTAMSAGVGDYVITVRITKWRGGYYFGYVIRDFQVSLVSIFTDTLNVFDPLALPQDAQGNYFVTVNPGDTVNVHSVYYGSGGVSYVNSYGEAFYFSNAPTVQTSSASGTTTTDLTWVPNATQARAHPYIFTLRGTSPASIGGQRQMDATFLVYVNGIPTDTCTVLIGFHELEGENNEIIVFPNPVTNELRIENADLPAGQAGLRIEKIELYDLIGEKVFQSNISNPISQISVNIRQLPSGIYFVTVKTDKGIRTAKFVKE